MLALVAEEMEEACSRFGRKEASVGVCWASVCVCYIESDERQTNAPFNGRARPVNFSSLTRARNIYLSIYPSS